LPSVRSIIRAARGTSSASGPTQAVTGEPGDYRLTRIVRDIEVPAAVEALLAARIDRLPPEDRHVLQSAAVIGTAVPLALLGAIEARPDDALGEGITRLQAAEFLYEKSGTTETEYTFKHALTHEVAYGSLPAEGRRALHARVVDALEARNPDQSGEMLAQLGHHTLKGEIWDKALAYLREAGEKAAVRSAYREAATAYEQALAALGHLPESRETIEQSIDLSALRVVLQPLHELDRILTHLQPAEGLAEQLGDRVRLARVLSGLCNTWWARSEHDRAVALGIRALELGNALGDITLRVEATIRLGAVHYSLGNYLTAVSFLRASLQLMTGRPELERLGFSGVAIVLANTWLSLSLGELGEFAEGQARAEEGLRVATLADQPFSLIAAHLSGGTLNLLQGHFEQAAAAIRSGVELGRTWAIYNWTKGDAGLACALAIQGERDLAIRALEDMLPTVSGTGVGLFLTRRATWIGEAARACGRPEEARQCAEEALRRARAHKERGDEAWALRLLGDIAADREQTSEAEAHYRDALALAKALGMRPLAAHCHRGLGKLHQRSGALQDAQRELAMARDLYRDMGMTFWLERTGSESA
jgi:tetratricopeptide (TPR) repeat protein